MKKEIKNLVKISNLIGGNPAFVQGGGGNTSVKINDKLMAIKASGYLLKDMIEDDGFSIVNYKNIKQHINKIKKISDVSESEFVKSIKSEIEDIKGYPILRPSIETGFHSLLDKYVVHTHSIYANIITCSKEGRKIAEKLFPNCIWVEYANPGKELTIKVKDALKGAKEKKIIFLQNHGPIVSGKDKKEVLFLHKNINEKIREYFKIEKCFNVDSNICVDIDIDFLNNNVIFPDQVVFGLAEELRQTQSGIETLCAYDYIIKAIKNLALDNCCVSKKDVDYLMNMESEKYRKKLVKK